jgi:hypothetical protein
MSDEERFGESFIDTPETAVESALATSALGPLAQRQESIAQHFVEDGSPDQLAKKSHFRSWREAANLYPRASYLISVLEAQGLADTPILGEEGTPLEYETVVDEEGEHRIPKPRGFRFPDVEEELIRRDLRYRASYRERTLDHLEKITKIFERGEPGRRGGLFRR